VLFNVLQHRPLAAAAVVSVDYDMLEKTAKLFRPKLIVAGEDC
jgi:glycine/serine hydroxymethyltransferase